MPVTYRCPECGSNILRVEMTSEVPVRFDPEDGAEVLDRPSADVDYTWSDESYVRCTGCNLGDRMENFKVEC